MDHPSWVPGNLGTSSKNTSEEKWNPRQRMYWLQDIDDDDDDDDDDDEDDNWIVQL